MPWFYGILLTAFGWALVLGAQWASVVAPATPPYLPRWGDAALPTLALLLVGLYLALVVAGRSPRWLMALQAALALVAAGLPLAYAYGLAPRYGLPASGGPVGTLLAGPLARGLGALWLVLAVVQAVRAPARGLRTLPPGRHARREEADEPPFWTPSPVSPPAEPAPGGPPPTYVPSGDGASAGRT